MTTGTRIVCSAYNQVALAHFDIEEPQGNEVRVSVTSSAVSAGTERANILNLGGLRAPYPRNLGYSFCGVVEQTGEEAQRFKPGDRVCGQCLGHQSAGNAREADLIPVPPGVGDLEAALTTIGVISLQGIRKASIELGESAAVVGLGIVGLLACRLSSLHGAVPVVGIDRSEHRVNVAFEGFADHSLRPVDDETSSAVRRLTENDGPPVVIESTGHPAGLLLALDIAASHGRIILLGSTRGECTLDVYRTMHKKNLTVRGAYSPTGNPRIDSYPGHWTWAEDARCFLDLVARRRIVVDPMISDVVDIKKAVSIYRRLLDTDDTVLGVVIDWKK